MSQITANYDRSTTVTSRNKNSEVVHRFLHAFASRQTLLSVVRGACWFVLLLIPLAMFVTLLDGMRWLNDPWRWGISCCAYAVAIMGAWRMGLHSIGRNESVTATASRVEDASPRFRESLLSSVELRGMDGQTRSGSAAFVDAIEHDVAREVKQLEIDELLPWNVLFKGFIACSMLLLGTLFLCAVPYLQYPQRLARAMLPFVSIPRPSNVRIDILEPSPSSLSVPSEQTLRFLVEVEGVLPNEASLEFSEPDESFDATVVSNQVVPSRMVKMQLESDQPRRFSVAAAVGSKPTYYRILAGDGETTWQRLTTISRPKPVQFHASTTAPKYVSQEIASEFYALEQSSARGDLQALKGSRIRLEIDINQPLASGRIELEGQKTGRKESIALKESKPTHQRELATGASRCYFADIDVSESARYQLKLVSNFQYESNPLENSFSPFYRIEAMEDPAAIVQWVGSDKGFWTKAPSPSEIFVIAPNELVSLSASVTDNLPVDQITHEIAINRGEWRSVATSLPLTRVESTNQRPTGSKSIYNATALWNWDLVDLKPESGDTIASRVKAVDLNGSIAYSPVVTFSIAALGHERDRYENLQVRAKLVPFLSEFADMLASKRDASRIAIDLIRNGGSTDEQRLQACADLRSTATEALTKARAIRAQAETNIRELQRGLDQSELELTVRCISRIERDYLQSIDASCRSEMMTAGNAMVARKPNWFRDEREAKLNRMRQSLDQATDQARRTLEIYRQFVGLELQNCLTKDLTSLMLHQRTLLEREPKVSFDAMVRSQKLTDQFFMSATKLAQQHEPFVNQDVRDRLPELYRWVDQTMLELKDLSEIEFNEHSTEPEREQAHAQLRGRIQRSSDELRGVRWAFNLGGNMIWGINSTRLELFNTSGSLRYVFNETMDRVRRRNDAVREQKEPNPDLALRVQSLEQDLTGPSFTALGQMLDRRDLHQRRATSDPMFTGDMGLAHRAWTSVLESWIANPTEFEPRTKDLEEVAKAYFVLEAGHELMDAKLSVQYLRSKEQYDWKTLEGQFNHANQWDGAMSRIEWTLQMLRDSGIPNEVIEKFNAVRYQEPAQGITQKLHPRRDPNNQNLVSASEDFQKLMVQWTDADKAIFPMLEAARATLSKFAPSVSELAERAAQATEELKKQTQQVEKANDPQATDPKAIENKPNDATVQPTDLKVALATLEKQQLDTEVRLQRLQDALIELASRQDLLKKNEQQAARDSDRALKLLAAVELPMNQALADAKEAIAAQTAAKVTAPNAPNEVSKQKLSDAVEREANAVEALKDIESHFDKLQKSEDGMIAKQDTPLDSKLDMQKANQDLQQSSEALGKMADAAARQLSLDPESPTLRDEKKDFAQADELAKVAQSDPRSMLAELERELKSNAQMQAELSDIAKANAESVANSLKTSANQEKSLANQLEQSDPKLQSDKQRQQERAQALAEQIDRLTARALNKASQAAHAAGKHDEANRLDQAAQELRSKASSMQQQNQDSPRENFQKSSEALAEQLTKAQQQVQKSVAQIDPLVGAPQNKPDGQAMDKQAEEALAAKVEAQRVNSRNEMQNVQGQMRNEMVQQATEAANGLKQRKDQAKNEERRMEDALKNARKQREDAKRNFDKDPANANALEHLQTTATQEEQIAQQAQSLAERAKLSEQLHTQAEARKNSLEQAPKADLDKPNPQAALASEQLAKAHEQLESMQRQLDEWNQGARALAEPKSSSTALANLDKAQKSSQENVRALASELDRAARHEQRLRNEKGSQTLKDMARSIEQSAEGVMKQASQELSQSAKDANAAEENQAKSTGAEQPIDSIQRPSTQGPQRSLSQASEELMNKSKQLNQAVSESSAASQASKSSPSSEANQTGKPDQQGKPGSDPSSSSPSSSNPSESSDQDKARMLDQLDRQVNSKQDDTNRALQDSVRQSADRLSSAMTQDRLNQKASTAQSKSNGQSKSSKQGKNGQRGPQSSAGEDRSNPKSQGPLPNRSFEANREWGKLRDQRADDVLEGRRDEYDPEFSEAIQAYYRSMGKP
jgi:hypothetical protein